VIKFFKGGAGDGTRTRDNLLGRQLPSFTSTSFAPSASQSCSKLGEFGKAVTLCFAMLYLLYIFDLVLHYIRLFFILSNL
jgi:hypothetical protein